ncbi:dienelactone hydrolase family protein, partial [Nocardia sp. CY41]|uniref:dienelactone hydrolase family protein n=1 Tax=Nocardia sp. CY41 TaxID=2608686 RepID=UPI0019151948
FPLLVGQNLVSITDRGRHARHDARSTPTAGPINSPHWETEPSAHDPLTVVLFHSMFGLRPVELSAAERLRGRGHRVLTPDLFAGSVVAGHGSAPALEDGFALMERIGWDTIMARARAAVRDLPADTVLGGFSMGVGVIGSLWPDRLAAAGVFLLHATTIVPEGIPLGTPVQAHVAAGDRFAPPDQLAAYQASSAHARAEATLHSYPGTGHFYTDSSLPDHDPDATHRTWQHIDGLLHWTRSRRHLPHRTGADDVAVEALDR